MHQINDKHLEAILEAVQALVQGDLNREVHVDAQGIVANLAGTINKLILNLRQVHPSLDKVSAEAPVLASTAQSVATLMHDSTQLVLDKADALVSICTKIEEELNQNENCCTPQCAEEIKKAKSYLFEIISAQSYQDRARQQLEKLEQKLQMIRDALLKVLIVMNLKDRSAESLANTKKLLEEVQQPEAKEGLKQDLVDELLAEFGL